MFWTSPRRAAHVPAPRQQPPVARHPGPRRRRPARDRGYVRSYGPATPRPRSLLAGQRPERGAQTAQLRWFSGLGDRLVAVDVEGTTAYVVREDVDALAAAHAVGVGPASSRARPMGDRPRHQGHPRHATAEHREAMTRKANPVIYGGVVSGGRGAKGRRAHRHMARRGAPTRHGHQAGGRTAGRHARPRPPPGADGPTARESGPHSGPRRARSRRTTPLGGAKGSADTPTRCGCPGRPPPIDMVVE